MVNISILKLQVVRERGARYNLGSRAVMSPYDVYNAINEVFEMQYQAEEVLGLLCLDTNNKILGAFEVARGSLTSTIVHPREVFKRALSVNAASIIIGHNHPSGNANPSQEDINFTMRLKEAGEILGIKLLDHVVIGDNRYISFDDHDLL